MAIHIPGLIAIIVFYLLILGVGLWAARKTGLKRDEISSDDVMLARRNIGLLIGCITMTATWVGGGFINGSAEIIVSSGLVWCQAPLGYAISLFLGGFFFAEKMRKRRYGTMLDPFNRKYGDLMGALLYIPAMLGEIFWSAAILSALGATLAVIIELDTKISIIISAFIALIYTLVGGLYSVACTDVVQLACIFVGLWVSVPFAMNHPASSSITENPTGTWLKEVAAEDIGVYTDTLLLLIFGGMPWQIYFQRVLSAKTPQYARLLSYVAGVGCLVMALPAVLIGAVAANTDWNQTNYDQQINGSIPSDQLSLTLPLVLRYLTPDAVAFIGLGAVSAAVMSSTDSSLLSSSSMFARNVFGVVYTRVSGHKPSGRLIVWIMRISQVILAGCACALAISATSIYYLFYLCSDLVYVIIHPQLTCAMYMPDTNTYGSLAGFIFGLLFRLLGGEEGLGIPAAIHFPWYSKSRGQLFPFKTVAMMISMASLISVSYLANYLFKNGILPKRADIFGCFSDGSVISHIGDQEEEKSKHSRHKVETDIPPSYIPYVRETDPTVKQNLANRGRSNPGFEVDDGVKSHKIGLGISIGNQNCVSRL